MTVIIHRSLLNAVIDTSLYALSPASTVYRQPTGSNNAPIFFRAKHFRAMMHKGTLPRAAIHAQKRTLVHHRAEKIGADVYAWIVSLL